MVKHLSKSAIWKKPVSRETLIALEAGGWLALSYIGNIVFGVPFEAIAIALLALLVASSHY